MSRQTTPTPTPASHTSTAHPRPARYLIGIDLSDRHFTVSVLDRTTGTFTDVPDVARTPEGLASFTRWLEDQRYPRRSTLLALETTGVLSEMVCLHLFRHRYAVALVDAARLARMRPPSRSKTDRTDSRAIADFAWRHTDELRLWQPHHPDLERIDDILGLREHYVRQRTASKNRRLAMQKSAYRHPDLLASIDEEIQALTGRIARLTESLRQVIGKHPKLQALCDRLDAIPGIDLLLAANLLHVFTTDDGTTLRTDRLNPRALANYFGIAPHQYQSGTSVHRRPRSSKLGPSRIRKLLTLAARSLRTHRQPFKDYFLRKQREGKQPRLILNNIANKLVRIICATVRNETSYDPNYNPNHNPNYSTIPLRS